ncbi:DNA-binding protein [Pseudomonas koreensis]|uniref:DNA-binding protein n=1 Tax=Pseudomonas koreensis TaxID=198620 RepID=UPI003F85D67D
MGRDGITRQMVKNAKATLMAQGLYPSIHAVRVALGNTGSNSTISRYLKELEQPPKTSLDHLSEPLLILINDMSKQLKEEAYDELKIAEVRFTLEREKLALQLTEAHRQIQQCQLEIAALEKKLQSLRAGEETSN